ncbi:MAG TPA: sulfite reductase [Gammaproteobacteria bacterium]|nr:sulfite reductase [Gammaproteobacteria bacterium]
MSNNNEFPFAPDDWTMDDAKQVASAEGLELTDDHLEVIQGIQEYFDKTDVFKPRQLLDALDERFHSKGGLKYLYTLLPKGPVAQGCRISGMNPPAGTVDQSFGSVQ